MVCRNHAPSVVEGCVACKPPVRQQLAKALVDLEIATEALRRIADPSEAANIEDIYIFARDVLERLKP